MKAALLKVKWGMFYSHYVASHAKLNSMFSKVVSIKIE